VKRNRNKGGERGETIYVWTYEQARRVLPYVSSIMRSLREHALEASGCESKVRRLAARPGRPERRALIALEEATKQAAEASDRFQDALDELHTLDVYCLDAHAGLALIPFAQDNQLAWYIFDLFDSDSLRFWRYHTDPLDMRRPIDVLSGPSQNTPLVV
jgi:hypothetical protein